MSFLFSTVVVVINYYYIMSRNSNIHYEQKKSVNARSPLTPVNSSLFICFLIFLFIAEWDYHHHLLQRQQRRLQTDPLL